MTTLIQSATLLPATLPETLQARAASAAPGATSPTFQAVLHRVVATIEPVASAGAPGSLRVAALIPRPVPETSIAGQTHLSAAPVVNATVVTIPAAPSLAAPEQADGASDMTASASKAIALRGRPGSAAVATLLSRTATPKAAVSSVVAGREPEASPADQQVAKPAETLAAGGPASAAAAQGPVASATPTAAPPASPPAAVLPVATARPPTAALPGQPLQAQLPAQQAVASATSTQPAGALSTASAPRNKIESAASAIHLQPTDAALIVTDRTAAPIASASGGVAPLRAADVPSSGSALSVGIAHTFERLDTAGPGNVTNLRTDARNLEVGVQSGSLGWVEVRATSDAQGQISASLHAQSELAAQSLANHADQIVAYAQQHAVSVDQVTVGAHAGQGAPQQQHGESADKGADPRPGESVNNEQGTGEAPEQGALTLISVHA
jgi:hypothetical protein